MSTWPKKHPRAEVSGLFGAMVLVGYWYGTPLLYGGHVIPVALSTACGFFLSGIGITTAAGGEGWPTPNISGRFHPRSVTPRICSAYHRSGTDQRLGKHHLALMDACQSRGDPSALRRHLRGADRHNYFADFKSRRRADRSCRSGPESRAGRIARSQCAS